MIPDEIKDTALVAFDGNADAFKIWMNSSIPSLENSLPIELIKTQQGIDLVKSELIRIEHSIY